MRLAAPSLMNIRARHPPTWPIEPPAEPEPMFQGDAGATPPAAAPLEHSEEPKHVGSECVIRLITVARALVAELGVSELSARQVLPHSPCPSRSARAKSVPAVPCSHRRNDLSTCETMYAARTTRGGSTTCVPLPSNRTALRSAGCRHSRRTRRLRSPTVRMMHATYALYAAARVLG